MRIKFMQKKKTGIFLLAVLFSLTALMGCGGKEKTDPAAGSTDRTAVTEATENISAGSTESLESTESSRKEERNTIIVLYTNDVHCASDSNPGYAALAAYKEAAEKKTPYVTLVDCGDSVQGDPIGSITQGEYPIRFMNQVGYDYAILGNHEFDFGMDQLKELLEQSEATYLGCNITYSGVEENALEALKPYAIESYGDVDVAFIGVSTPESITQSTPAEFMDDYGNYVYGFSAESKEAFYSAVQKNIDECREKGADYVVLLTHLGTDEVSEPFRSTDLIGGTTGVDVMLDGHSHSVIPCQYVNNKEGQTVLLSSTGSKFAYIGQLMITEDGTLTTTLVSGTLPEDEEVTEYIEQAKADYEKQLSETVGKTEVKLTISSEKGMRLVRNRETNLGDFCADAFRVVSGADIAFINGGGIRSDIEAGDITYGDILEVNPYGNTLCVAKATGQEILDALEMACRETMADTDDGKNPIGECGGFQQVSGLKFTIDTSIPSTVELDENAMFVSCGANRRVKDVQVLQKDGTYKAIDPAGTYTVASHNYFIKECGDGFNMFRDNELVINEGMADYQVLITYLSDDLKGVAGDGYKETQGRINVK